MRLIIRFICISMLCSPLLNYANNPVLVGKINSILNVNRWCQTVTIEDHNLKLLKKSIPSDVFKTLSSYPNSTALAYFIAPTCLETLKSITSQCIGPATSGVMKTFFECAQLSDTCRLVDQGTNESIKNYDEYQKITVQGGTKSIDSNYLVNNFELVGCDDPNN